MLIVEGLTCHVPGGQKSYYKSQLTVMLSLGLLLIIVVGSQLEEGLHYGSGQR